MTDMNPDYQYGPPTQPGVPTPQQGYPQPPQQQYAPLPPVNNYIVPPKASKKWVFFTFFFLITTLAALGAGAWAYLEYLDQKENTDAKISTATALAVKVQADKDAAAFLEKEKQPNRLFAGPENYGRLTFQYPKTWSIYVPKDSEDGSTYEAYFSPVSVPQIDNSTQYALRVRIEPKTYESVVSDYNSLVKKGDLKATAFKAGDTDGTRLDGSFTKNIRGAAVILKIRDKTVTIRSDAETFKPDFDALVSTITFNK